MVLVVMHGYTTKKYNIIDTTLEEKKGVLRLILFM
jgi:hypothetical protein